MDLKIQSNTVLMIRRLLDRASPVKVLRRVFTLKARAGQRRQKIFPAHHAGGRGDYRRGLSKKYCAALRDDPSSELHTLMILRGGQVAFGT